MRTPTAKAQLEGLTRHVSCLFLALARSFFDTAEEAIEHGAEECGVEGNGPKGRVYDEQGCTVGRVRPRARWIGAGGG